MKSVACALCVFLIAASLVTVSNVPAVKAQGAIHIRADGRIEPSTALITTSDNKTYTFSGDIFDTLFLERDNIVVNGAGYTIRGDGTGHGILVSNRNVTITSMKVENFQYGIHLYSCYGNVIRNNNVSNNYMGLLLYETENTIVSQNSICANSFTAIIVGQYSSNITILENNITGNRFGIRCEEFSNDTIISHNNFEGNSAVDIDFYRSNGNTIIGNRMADTQDSFGIEIYESNNTLATENNITSAWGGIIAGFSVNCTISHNYLFDNQIGIALNFNCSDSHIIGNNVTRSSLYGIGIEIVLSSDNNTIIGNYVSNHFNGIWVAFSSGNRFYHNSIVGNQKQTNLSGNSSDSWDDGYFSGNYWSDYSATDFNHDGIGDTPYIINENNIDHYPLIQPWTPNAVRGLGDVNSDGIVDISDIVKAAESYCALEGEPNWDPNADMAPPYGRIDIFDLVTIATNYGNIYP